MKYTTKYILSQFENAVRVHEMKGSRDPEEWDSIETTYKEWKRVIKKCLKKKKIKL